MTATAAAKTHLPRETVDLFLKKRGWAWEKLMRGECPMSIEQIELYLVASDKVLFASTFLKNRTTIPGSDIVRGEPLKLLPYQAELLRYDGNFITQDGAEIGKTLDIIIRLFHGLLTVPGSESLLGAPELVHILEVVDAIEEMLSLCEMLQGSIFVQRRAPHHVIASSIGAKVHMIPAGFDGTAFRGKHVGHQALFDEAAKIKNRKTWSEFFRSCMPGCRAGVTSVPDGDRSTWYYEQKERARKAGDGVSVDDFKFFHRPKTIQSSPFFSPARDAELITKYGGRHTQGYTHNVLGLDGDPANPIFPYTSFMRLVGDVSEYRLLKIESSGETGITWFEVFSASPPKKDEEASAASLFQASIESSELKKHPEELASLIKNHLPSVDGVIFFGADPGKINDPCEIMIFRRSGANCRLVARVSMRGVDYDLQAEVIHAIYLAFGAKAVGVDVGGVGTALFDALTSSRFAASKIEDALKGSLFNEKIDAINEDGEVVLKENSRTKEEEPVRKTLRQVFVEILVGKVQRGELQFPYDLEIIHSFTSLTAREGQGGNLIFSKEDDHIVDAVVQALAAWTILLNTSVSAFSGGAFSR